MQSFLYKPESDSDVSYDDFVQVFSWKEFVEGHGAAMKQLSSTRKTFKLYDAAGKFLGTVLIKKTMRDDIGTNSDVSMCSVGIYPSGNAVLVDGFGKV